MPPNDPEWTLSAGDLRATVSPFGAALRRLWIEPPGGPPRDLLWGYSGTANKKGGQGDVLMPFPGRIAGGTYSFQGKRHELAKNDKEGPNAIHGFVRSRLWDGDNDGATARFRTRIAATDHPGYPFDLEIVVGYELSSTGLSCAFVARNAGTTAAPFGAGFHPYVLANGPLGETELQIPAHKLVEFEHLLPTGRVLDIPQPLDFRKTRKVGGVRLNHCFTGLAPGADGFTRVRAGDVEVWMDRSFAYVVVYSGDSLPSMARQSLAIEPMTCATDAFNHPALGMRVLLPGETISGTWGIALRHQRVRDFT